LKENAPQNSLSIHDFITSKFKPHSKQYSRGRRVLFTMDPGSGFLNKNPVRILKNI
jgi:hypothetical protein